jgi:hypothetical protein
MARRIGLLHMCYARTLADELGDTEAVRLVERAIWRYGTLVGERTKAEVERQGLEPTVENFDAGSDLSPLGFGEGCPLAEVWREYGEEQLGALYCQVDPAKMQAYAPGWTMVHTRQVPLGDECCETEVRPLEG